MTYVVSDLHGSYSKFKELLEKINFSDDDVMYVDGDIVDYGEDPIGLLCDLSMRYNVLPIVGDHDYKALKFLRVIDRMLDDGSKPDIETLTDMAAWISEDGGQKTMEGFKALDKDMREGVLDYLSDMALYEEITVKGKKYIIAHAGISGFDPQTPLEDYMPEDFISGEVDFEREYFDDVTLIVGHLPTYEIPDADKGLIYYGEGSIDIDCGAAFGEKLGCLCLDNGREYYV